MIDKQTEEINKYLEQVLEELKQKMLDEDILNILKRLKDK